MGDLIRVWRSDLQLYLNYPRPDDQPARDDSSVLRLQPDRGLHAEIEPPSPVLVPGIPNALQIDVYGYWRAPKATVHIKDATTIGQLVEELNSLRAIRPGGISSMHDDGSCVVLTFSYPDGAKRGVTLHPNSRQIASAADCSGWSSRRLLEHLDKILPKRLTPEQRARVDAYYRSLEEQRRSRARRTLSTLMAHRPIDDQVEAKVVDAFLARLRSEETRHRAADALKAIASIISGSSDVTAIPWTTLRYEHTEAIWLLLADRYDSSTGDLYLTVLRGVLRTAWQRGHLSTNDYLRAADLTPIGRGQLWKGRNAALGNEFNARIDLDLTQYARAQQGGRGGVRE